MKIIALLIAILMILLGLIGVFWPEGLMEFAKYTFTSSGIYVAAAVRIALGLLLFSAAKATRTPKTVRVIGLILVAGGIATALLTVERAQLLRDWCLRRGPDVIRALACIPLVLGSFVAGATVTKDRNSS